MDKKLFRVEVEAKQTWIAEIFTDDERTAEEWLEIKILENIVEEVDLWTYTEEIPGGKPSGKYVCYEQVPGTDNWKRIIPEK
ncbi:hypothetical protein FJZ31_14035 [Candidatus Poribacteria bacterium]|nr:hypothetical protein [Candidatus Poribacteria bacterium]